MFNYTVYYLSPVGDPADPDQSPKIKIYLRFILPPNNAAIQTYTVYLSPDDARGLADEILRAIDEAKHGK